MRVLSTEATTPNGNKYKITRLGRIIGAGSFSAWGLAQSVKNFQTDEYAKRLADSAKNAGKYGLHNFPKLRKGVFVASSAAIVGFCGFIAGGLVDFVINRNSKKKADETKLNTKA